MKAFQKIITILIVLFSVCGTVTAQSTIEAAQAAAAQLYRTYDSIPYLTFDARYKYFTDTAYSEYTTEVVKGAYTMNGKKARYTLGDVEYLQNDSFLVAVYHKDQMMVVSNPPVLNAGSYMPTRELLDSLLTAYSAHYDIWVKTVQSGTDDLDTLGYIKFIKKNDNDVAQYNHFIIEFDLRQYVITKIEYEYQQPGLGLTEQDEPDAALRLLRNTPRKKTLSIELNNYRFDHLSDTDYSENVFIWEEDGEYKPVEKYKDYKVYNARN